MRMHFSSINLRLLTGEINGGYRRTLIATEIYEIRDLPWRKKSGAPIGGGTLWDMEWSAQVWEEEARALEAAAGGGEKPQPNQRA
jgi:hypothetical protein